MKRTPLIFMLALAACSSSPPVESADATPPLAPRPGPPVDEAIFKTLDIDGDGYISRGEARRDTNVERMFNELDANRDGRLSREELKGLYPVEMPGDAANRKAAGNRRS